MAARAQLVDEVIRPAMADGKTVVSDRFLLANLVYQGHAGGLDVESIRTVGAVAIDGVAPDAVFLLDMPPAAADERIRRARDRMEQQGDDYRQRLREGFLTEAARAADHVHMIDAARTIDAVQSDIRRIAMGLFERRSVD
jgi:dTMP kinase